MEISTTAKLINNLILDVLASPKNLCSESELRVHAKAALAGFVRADKDKTGYIDIDEVKALCEFMGVPVDIDEESELAHIDTDKSGEVSLEEWLSMWLKRTSCLADPSKQQAAIARNTFKTFDTDGSGALDYAELKRVLQQLGADFSESEYSEALKLIDADGTGSVNESEFIDWWTDRMSASKGEGLIALKLKQLASKAKQIFYTDVFTAIWKNDLALVKIFVEADSRVVFSSDESINGGGWTPLHYAAYQGNEAIVDFLISSGAKIDALNNSGFSPLFYAAQQGNVECCKLLLKAEANPAVTGVVDDQFMCPAEHCLDSKELYSLFADHPQCAPPTTIPCGAALCAEISTKGILTLRTPPQRQFTSLPVMFWEVAVHDEGRHKVEEAKNDTGTVKLIIPARPPSKPQVVEAQLDVQWLRQLCLSKKSGDSSSLSLNLQAVTAMRDRSPPISLMVQSYFSYSRPVKATTPTFSPTASIVVRTDVSGDELKVTEEWHQENKHVEDDMVVGDIAEGSVISHTASIVVRSDISGDELKVTGEWRDEAKHGHENVMAGSNHMTV